MSLSRVPRVLLDRFFAPLSAQECLWFGLTSRRYYDAFISTLCFPWVLPKALKHYCKHGYIYSLSRLLDKIPHSAYLPMGSAIGPLVANGHTGTFELMVRRQPNVFIDPWIWERVATSGNIRNFKNLLQYATINGLIPSHETDLIRAAVRSDSKRMVRLVISEVTRIVPATEIERSRVHLAMYAMGHPGSLHAILRCFRYTHDEISGLHEFAELCYRRDECINILKKVLPRGC
jgi:hypothetical protein